MCTSLRSKTGYFEVILKDKLLFVGCCCEWEHLQVHFSFMKLCCKHVLLVMWRGPLKLVPGTWKLSENPKWQVQHVYVSWQVMAKKTCYLMITAENKWQVTITKDQKYHIVWSQQNREPEQVFVVVRRLNWKSNFKSLNLNNSSKCPARDL